MQRKITRYLDRVRIIRDPRDSSRDYWIPLREAEQLYLEGKLDWNETNECYCTR